MNPCSVPRSLRFLAPIETPEQQACCAAHDQAYAAGGARRDRAIADAEFLVCLLRHGMDLVLAAQYHAAVRTFGEAHWNGGSGLYSDDPHEMLDPMETEWLARDLP
jgi:hypothetical protein